MLRRAFIVPSLAVLAVGCERKAETPTLGLPTADSTSRAPDVFRTRFETSKGVFVVETHRDWAPRGADRFYHLVRSGFFDNTRFFRVVTSFMVQFGMSGDPAVNAAWEPLTITDDSVTQSNTRGMVTFAKTSLPNSRTTQIFINLVDNRSLDGMGFAPFGRVVQGMEVVDSLYADYGDGPPGGFGPLQDRIRLEGNEYLAREFPKLDFVRSARLEADTSATGAQ
jgi:peptidyl-prolyl cis-trans isomerase A (cyclophilin A)